jgi:hypothetical protein
VSGRVDGTLPSNQTGIRSIGFPLTNTVPHTWQFGTDGTTQFPDNIIKTSNDGQLSISTPSSGNSHTTMYQDSSHWEILTNNELSAYATMYLDPHYLDIFAEDNDSGANPAWARIRAELPTTDTPKVFIENQKGSDGIPMRWTFGTDGTTTFPNLNNNTNSQIYTTNGGNQTVFETFNTEIGRGSGQKLTLDYDDVAVLIQSRSGKEWKFDQYGNTILPNFATISSVDVGVKNTFTTNGDGHPESNTNSITIGIGDPALVEAITADPQNYFINFNWDSPYTFYTISSITGPRSGTNVYTLTGTWPANSGAFPIDLVDGEFTRNGRTIIGVHQLAIESGGKTLLFDGDGNLKVPGNISFNSDTTGLGNSIDLSRDITISSGKNIIIKPGSNGVVGSTSWVFGEDSLTFPDSTVQTTAYQQVTVPVTSKGVNGDTAGRIAFDSDYIYYCTASYDGDNNIWKRVALSTDTWDYTPPPPVTYSLTVISAGDGDGTVTSTPAGISTPTLTATFEENTSVTLSANAQIGSTFAGWSGAASGTAPAQITMDGDKTVTATFDLNSPPPPPPPTPSYNYSVDNVTPSLGTPVTITITTTDVEDGTTLYWQLTNTQTPSGFDTDTSGYITISGNTAAVTITMTDDGGLGDHTVQTIQWTFNLYSDSGYLDQLVQFSASGADQYI